MIAILANVSSVSTYDERLFWACLFGMLFLVFFTINAHFFYAKYKAKTREEFNRVHSPTPFWGGIVGAIAVLLLPIPGAAYWCWVPFLIEPGSAYELFGFLNKQYFHIGGQTHEKYFEALNERFRKNKD